MNIYDTIIEKLDSMTGKTKAKCYAAGKKNWQESKDYELILQKEMAYELGGNARPSVNLTCVTDNPDFFHGDEIVVYGPDLGEIKDAVPYARITLLLSSEIEGENNNDILFRAIQAMDFIKYKVYPKGYMVRTSGMTNREQVRISKKAVKAGISFEGIGNVFIRHYKMNRYVKNVRIIFITAEDADFDGLADSAKKAGEITSSLSQIFAGMPTECGSCGLRDICDEVEGLKELHFGQKKA